MSKKSVGTIIKNTILFAFEEKTLKELRKVLFKKGLSPQEFFSYIIDLVAIRDPRLEELLLEANKVKQDKLTSGQITKKHRDANALYEAIENNIKQKNEQQEE